MDLIEATLLGLIVGVSGTITGGLLILYRFDNNLTKQSWLLGFSGGIMVAVVLFDLWPEAYHYGGVFSTVVGSAVGMALVKYFDSVLRLIPWYRKRTFTKSARVGILLGMGIGAHNFPEGVALGTTFIANQAISNWLGLALLMALHNVPEGMIMSSAFKIGKVGLWKIITALVLVEIPMAFGGTVGAFLGRISPFMIAASLGFAGGAMALLVLKELLPMAKKLSGFFWVGSGFAVGILAGVVLIRVT
ncbi:MAG: ZIP family metal transporter [Bacillota bacterium]